MPASTRWGEVVWGEALLGESATGSTHILEAHAGAALRADATRLGIRHPITAAIRMRSMAHGAGAGPAPIHPLRAIVALPGATATATTLSFRHHLQAAVALTFSAAPVSLTMGHKLAAGVISSFDADAFSLSIAHWLAAAMTGQLVASATDLDLSHPLAVTIIAQLGASARYALTLPVLVSLDELDLTDPTTFIAGSINLSPNPSLENDLLGWLTEDGGTLERSLGPARDGLWSAGFSRNGGGANAALVARSIEGMGIPPIGGSLAWGQAWLAAPTPIDVIVKARARYDDGAVDEGEASEPLTITATGLLGAWDRVLAPALPLDGLDETRTLQAIELVITPAALGDAAWWADTVVIEYDPWMVLADGFVPSGLPVGPQEGEEPPEEPGEGA